VHANKPIILLFILCTAGYFIHADGQVICSKAKDSTVTKIDILAPAIVGAVLRPKIKRDTIEYNTEHIKLRPNAMVEELLQMLPGLQIDANGNIIYNGEKIEHLLVDGEDIFSSDPTLVSRNFNADKIAKVQMLDRKSDRTLFTGFDDGVRIKTLNLVMKESAKNGYFGKVDAGENLKGYYVADGAVAGFKDKEQFTGLGLSSNIGVTAFSNAGIGGSIGLLSNSQDPLGASVGTGIPTFTAGALHYSNVWNGTEDHMTGNYQYSHFYSQPITITNILQTEAGSIYGQNQKSQSTNEQNNQWLHFVYDWSLNDQSAFQLTINGNSSKGQNQFNTSSGGDFNETPVNSTVRSIQDRGNQQHLNANAGWRVEIGPSKKGIFSIYNSIIADEGMTNGYLYAIDRFFQSNGLLLSADTIDQRKQIIAKTIALNNSLHFLEPLRNEGTLGAGYGINIISDNPFQGTFDRGDGDYKIIVDSLSSRLHAETIQQEATVNFRQKIGHFDFYGLIGWFSYDYEQHNLLVDSVLHIHHNNFLPLLSLNYANKKGINAKFSYTAGIQEPSPTQLEPVPNNSNPLLVTLGNPGLAPAISQIFRVEFRRAGVWMINLNLNASFSNNSISTKTITDSIGEQISQPVNTPGNKTAGFNLSLNRSIAGWGTGLQAGGNYSQSATYINADLSKNDVYTGSGGFSLNRYVADQFRFRLNTNFAYFDQVSSINTTAPLHYWTQNHSAAITIFFIRNYEWNTSANYTWQEKTSAFSANTSILLLNSSISRNFLHNKLTAKCQLNNVFNQNATISRTNVGNVNTQTSSNILGRYWMFTVTYHFDKKFEKIGK
jgi:Outer membrane protein beta-barrel family